MAERSLARLAGDFISYVQLLAEAAAEAVGANGLLVGPDDSLQLEAALDRLLSDESLRESMRKQNIRKAERYSAASMAKSYDAVYRTIRN